MTNALQKVPRLNVGFILQKKKHRNLLFLNKCVPIKKQKPSRIPPTPGEQTLKYFLFFSTTVENTFLLNEKLFLICPDRRAADSTCQHIYFTPLHLNCHNSIHFPKHSNEYWYTCSFNAQGCTDLYELFSDKATCHLCSLIWNSSFR